VADAGGSLGYITMTTLHYIENYLQSQIALEKNYWTTDDYQVRANINFNRNRQETIRNIVVLIPEDSEW